MNLLAGNPLLRVAPATLPPPITVLVRCDKRRERPIPLAATLRFQRALQAFVPSLSDPAVCNRVVNILDLASDTLDQLPQSLGSAYPCRSCGGWPKHHVWCPSLGLNVLRAVHGEAS